MLLVDQVPTRLIPDAIKSGIIYKKIEVVKASIFVFKRKVGDSLAIYYRVSFELLSEIRALDCRVQKALRSK
jgi:hypothetical protein